ncbi:Hachiman antiphage defense system protein HamA [Nocardia sp. CA-290969]|uniref:Hachiman antiphage defense system protein HamA n=1 Tax=Nocardia sp. CA-290969 TaxID=3239986 RepID=UPI003D948F94
MSASEETTDAGIAWAAAAIPRHYAASRPLASILKGLGKPAAAEYLEGKLPTGKNTRSGDLGEIIGTQYAARELGYRMVARLRWKDHREMPMRGDDIIGVRAKQAGPLEFLKGEAKSRTKLTNTTVAEADEALQRDNGRPSPHALLFFADRLESQGEVDLANRIYAALLSERIAQRQVLQLLFTFTSSDPSDLLRRNTETYSGKITRRVVGLRVPGLQNFVAAAYTKVVADARKP